MIVDTCHNELGEEWKARAQLHRSGKQKLTGDGSPVAFYMFSLLETFTHWETYLLCKTRSMR